MLAAGRRYDNRVVEQMDGGFTFVPKRFLGLLARRTRGRQFALSKLGHAAMGPAAALGGNRIAVFRGARVPYLLRRAGFEKWELVGEAYVHGTIDGEAIVAQGGEDMSWIALV